MPADIDLNDAVMADDALGIGSRHMIASGYVLLAGLSRRHGWRLLRGENGGYIHISMRSY